MYTCLELQIDFLLLHKVSQILWICSRLTGLFYCLLCHKLSHGLPHCVSDLDQSTFMKAKSLHISSLLKELFWILWSSVGFQLCSITQSLGLKLDPSWHSHLSTRWAYAPQVYMQAQWRSMWSCSAGLLCIPPKANYNKDYRDIIIV